MTQKLPNNLYFAYMYGKISNLQHFLRFAAFFVISFLFFSQFFSSFRLCHPVFIVVIFLSLLSFLCLFSLSMLNQDLFMSIFLSPSPPCVFMSLDGCLIIVFFYLYCCFSLFLLLSLFICRSVDIFVMSPQIPIL